METDLKNKICEPPKACLFNLIIYTHEPRRAVYFQDIAQLISSKFPCRIIFIQGNATQKNGLKIGKQEEKISIEVNGDYLNRLFFIILPYFVSDLPIYLIWGEDPSKDAGVLKSLESYANKIVFDAESSENLQKFSLEMLRRLDESSIEITDMNWARIRSWRQVLTQTFDSKERIDQLNAAKQIKITYNDRPSDPFLHPKTQAIYLQGWLAAQLKWQFDHVDYQSHGMTIYYKNIEVILQGESKQKVHAEEILEFEVSDPLKFLYSLTRKGENQVIVHCNTLDRCELPLTLSLPSLWSGRVFMQEIFYKQTSEQYKNMLQLISQIPWKNNGRM